MPTDYEALAKMLINSPQGGKIIRGLDKFNAAISVRKRTPAAHHAGGQRRRCRQKCRPGSGRC